MLRSPNHPTPTAERTTLVLQSEDDPAIVVAKQNNALQIYALDDAAARLGLEIGLPLANARAICPHIKVFDADAAADAKTLNDIADWCDRFTPLVALDPPHGLFLDITGCAHLFGGEAALMRTMCGALTRQGFAVSAGDRRHLGLRAHDPKPCPWPHRCDQARKPMRSGRCRCSRSAPMTAIITRPAPRRAQNHRRRRLARAS